jgi:hypothetical protein
MSRNCGPQDIISLVIPGLGDNRPRWGKLVHQLLMVIAFAYDLCLGRMIACWKGIDEEINLGGSIRAFIYHLGSQS